VPGSPAKSPCVVDESVQAPRGLVRDSPSIVFLIADGKVVYANRRGEEALGIGRDEASSRGFAVFRLVAVAPECLDRGQESLRRRSLGEELPPADYALLTRDGRRIEGVLTSEIVERQGRRELLGVFTEKASVGAGGPSPGR
jgi:PAS domain S-box-containing protein